MALEGDLSDVAVAEIFHTIAAQGKTGILTLQGQDDIIAVSFLRGDIVAADSLNQTLEEGLGAVLVEQGLVSADQLQRLGGEEEERAARLTDTLVAKELLTRKQVLDALREQTVRLLTRLLAWKEGSFKFYGGSEVSFEEGFEPISVEDLVVGIATQEPATREQTDADLPALDSVFEPVEGAGPRGVVGGVGEGSDAGTGGAEARLVLEQLDGKRPLKEIAQRLELAEYPVLLAAARLRRLGRIRLRSAEELAAERTEAAAAEAARRERAAEPAPRREEARPARPRVRPVVGERPVEWAARAVAVLVLLLLGWGLATASSRVLLPFPWQEAAREGFERLERELLYLKIDRAARTHHLLTGGYPDRLETLVDLHLLGRGDLRDPAGRELIYRGGEATYEVLPLGRGGTLAHLGRREAVTGDFLLDSDFLHIPQPDEIVPLVLLD